MEKLLRISWSDVILYIASNGRMIMNDELGRRVALSKDTYQRICQKGTEEYYKLSHREYPASKPRNESRTSRKQEVLNNRS
jgi:hypothetical protein